MVNNKFVEAVKILISNKLERKQSTWLIEEEKEWLIHDTTDFQFWVKCNNSSYCAKCMGGKCHLGHKLVDVKKKCQQIVYQIQTNTWDIKLLDYLVKIKSYYETELLNRFITDSKKSNLTLQKVEEFDSDDLLDPNSSCSNATLNIDTRFITIEDYKSLSFQLENLKNKKENYLKALDSTHILRFLNSINIIYSKNVIIDLQSPLFQTVKLSEKFRVKLKIRKTDMSDNDCSHSLICKIEDEEFGLAPVQYTVSIMPMETLNFEMKPIDDYIELHNYQTKEAIRLYNFNKKAKVDWISLKIQRVAQIKRLYINELKEQTINKQLDYIEELSSEILDFH